MTDQQRFDTIAATGHPYMKTPHLDRLTREGVYFDNCFINAPSCVPSRAGSVDKLNRATHDELVGFCGHWIISFESKMIFACYDALPAT